MGQRVVPGIGQTAVPGTARERRAVIADQRADQAELPGRHPRLQRRDPVEDPDHLPPGRALAPPPVPGRGSDRGGQLRAGRAGRPAPAVREPGQDRLPARTGRPAGEAAGSGSGLSPGPALGSGWFPIWLHLPFDPVAASAVDTRILLRFHSSCCVWRLTLGIHLSNPQIPQIRYFGHHVARTPHDVVDSPLRHRWSRADACDGRCFPVLLVPG